MSKEALQKKKKPQKTIKFLLLRKVKGRGFEHNSEFISLRNQEAGGATKKHGGRGGGVGRNK